ncbi:penicillin-binding protein activator [Novimethylophilus kurashikiensis]|uniref:penicillin-binding protein activator n=1 Tax=Novimethylophilus kurashikiensis TaxID=1825523 RepID=UPI000D599DE8|nr:penicillin-binding protein activator [Novimethylophilus kurashikiensis]
MVQRLLTSLITALFALSCGVATAAEAVKSTPPTNGIKPSKTAEVRYLDGLDCLKAKDIGCASVTLAGIGPASPYAKLLQAQIAAQNGAYDTPLRLLIPLQAETGLIPQASASLHATLALAYEAQDNLLNAVEQRVAAEPFLEQRPDIEANQASIWKLLSSQPRDALIELRGESGDSVVQGWIDLALAVQGSERKASSVAQWRNSYPDHPAGESLLNKIVAAQTGVKEMANGTGFTGNIALLLPLESPDYAAAARAVQAGVMAAFKAEGGRGAVQAYDSGGPEGVAQAYQQAVANGAQFVIGPLTRDEVVTLSNQNLTVPVLALNQPDTNLKAQANLLLFGLPVDAESRQIAHLARNSGMQTALVVAADNPLGQRMAKAFVEEWRNLGAKVTAQLTIPAQDALPALKSEAAMHPADMIFLAAGADQARIARPYLDLATPTYATSHIYDGASKSVQNVDLVAIHFVDLPWLVDPENPALSLFRSNELLPNAEMQRLYAMGLDAYRLVPLIEAHPAPGKKILDGATGNISVTESGALVRELPIAQFRNEGVALENMP